MGGPEVSWAGASPGPPLPPTLFPAFKEEQETKIFEEGSGGMGLEISFHEFAPQVGGTEGGSLRTEPLPQGPCAPSQ